MQGPVLAAVLVRRGAPVRRRPAPRHRHRCGRDGRSGRRARERDGELRRLRADERREPHDRDGRRVLGHAHASRLDRESRPVPLSARATVVATVGPSGTPEQSNPYVHLGIRLTAIRSVTSTRSSSCPRRLPRRLPRRPCLSRCHKPVPVPGHAPGGGLVVENRVPCAAGRSRSGRAARTRRSRAPRHNQVRRPRRRRPRSDYPEFRLPLVEPLLRAVRAVPEPVAPTIEPVPLDCSRSRPG